MTAAVRALAALRASLAAALPERIHSASFVDHPQRKPAELEQGVVTALLPEIEPGDWDSTLRLRVVGQLQVRKQVCQPQDVETAELALYGQLLAWLRNPGPAVPRLTPRSARFSSQLEFPYGWVALELDMGPLDEADAPDSETYPPNQQPGRLLRAHMDVDLAPHETRDEHNKWLHGDYSASRPELTLETQHHGPDHDQPETGG
ncbi:hypothetical protein HA051_08255 [Chromobacterium vaccinii]|uniref:hypothetical protein n=1 Tax=Chromobacterium violaceum TaxID=536 RepID=UPI00140C7410|nr:hypothetical protein [Chromobacterium violaceum]MBA8735332.1 hypothetical protein [Chromobacterium violaceum]NHQ81565.1 hypothetical protein [Chromobacterium vaccinii]